MKKLIAVCACVLCLTGCGSSPKSEKSRGNTAGNSVQNTTNNAKPKTFSSEDEINKYAKGFWVCEGKDDNSEAYKIRFFVDKGGFSWDFSVPSGKTFDEYIKDLIETSEQKNDTTFRSASEFLVNGTNIDGVEMSNFEIEPDLKNGAVKANGEVYGTFLTDGTFKCGDDIYTSEKSLTKLGFAFVKAKEARFQERYHNPISYKDLNPLFDTGTEFMITGTAELDDYYNYYYKGFEALYFCVCITPTGGEYSDRWYIYCSRAMHGDLLETLKNGSEKMMMVCSHLDPDALQNGTGMATIKDYIIL